MEQKSLRSDWLAYERKRAKYERKFKPIFQRALDYQIKDFLSDIKYISVEYTQFNDIEIDNTQIDTAYKQLYNEIAFDFGKEERKKVLKMAGKFQTKEDDIAWESLFMNEIENYLQTGLVGSRIVAVGDTSKEILQKMVSDLIEEIKERNLTGSQAQTMLRDKLESTWHKTMRYRVERIVRTETTASSNWGQLNGVLSTGLANKKTWVASFSERTREAHAAANGQTVDINSPFIVDTDAMMFPGDPSASAGNVINCRCTLSYSIK